MNMKKLIESMDRIEECGMTEMPAMAPPAPEMDKGNPVTVNVSMNASGKEHVADLLDMMKNAGLGDAAPAADAMMSPRMDMERLSGIMGKPEHDHDDDDKMNLPAIADLDGGEDESYAAEMDDEEDTDESYSPGDENAEGMVSNCCSAPVQDERNGTGRCSACGEGCEAVAEEVETEDMSSEGTYTVKVKGKDMAAQEELARLASLSGVAAPQEMEVEAAGDYANEPDDQYSDLSAVIPDGDDLHKQKKSHPATAGGDNPMAIENIKAALYAALTEKKMSEGELPAALKAYQDKKKGKAPAKGKSKSGKMPMDAGKDGKKGTKDDKPAFLTKEEMTAEGRGKVMAGRGRGKKPKLMAGRGRGK